MAVDSLWSNVTLLLPCSADLLDVKQHAVTVVGNTALSSAVGTPFGAGNACYFDGSGDRLTLASSTDWAVGTGDFFIECWVYPTSFPGGAVTNDLTLFNVDGSPQFYFYLDRTTGKPTLWNGTNGYQGANAVTLNAWNYVWCRRASSTLTIGIGTTTGITQASYTSNFTASSVVTIGGAPDGSRNLFGYIGGMRITRASRTIAIPSAPFPRPTISGVVLNSSAAPDEKTVIVRDRNTQLYLGGANSDPSTGAYVFYPPDFGEVQVERVDALFDPDFHLVRLLCPFTSSLADSVGNAVTANNGAAISSVAGNPFGAGNALFLDGTDDYLSIPGASFSFTKVTIEAWIRPSALTGYRPFYAGENSRLAFYLLGTTLELGIWGVSGIVAKTSAITVANVWRHVAAVLDGGMASLFVDGSKVASAGYSSSIVAPSTLKIGKTDGTDYFAGYIGPIRVTAAARKITAAPSGPFLFSPTDGGSGENALIYDRVIPG